MSNLPTIQELHEDNALVSYKNDQLNLLLNQEPKKEWVKEHPFVKGHKYIPIDKVEFMLRKIFKKYAIEITGQGTSFNGVWVTVRVHYFHPTEATMMYHDGIGAVQLQTAKGTSPADLANINNGALSMAYPIAKTLAIKDACDHFGKLFGCDLNRKDTMAFKVDANPLDLKEQLIELFNLKRDMMPTDEILNTLRVIENNEVKSFNKQFDYLSKL
jgi:hypothetical protein